MGFPLAATGGTARVIAEVADSELRIRVEDDGVGLPGGWDPERPVDGLGLSVTRQRLEGFYPDGKSSFEIQPQGMILWSVLVYWLVLGGHLARRGSVSK